MEPWVILDARAVMHHSFNMGKDPEGILGEDNELYNTAEYAFRNFLDRYMDAVFKMVNPRRVLIAMDGGIEYRRSIHPDYKKRREDKKKERDPVQMEQSAKFYRNMQSFWAATGCTVGRVKGVEADDLIAYFCERLPGKKMVYTTDGDLTALLKPEYDTMVTLSLEAMLDDHYKFSGGPENGVPVGATNLITVAKSLLGDSSDQYGGIKGFGPKKWEELVERYGYDGIQELEECVKSGDFTPLQEAVEACPDDKVLQLILNNTETWTVQYALAKLHPELCEGVRNKRIIEIEWFRRVPELKRLEKVLNDMNCLGTHIDRYEDYCVQSWLLDLDNIEDGDIEEALEEFAKSPSVAFDYETQDAKHENFVEASGEDYVDIMTSGMAGASFCFGENHQYCFYVPTNHKDSANMSKDTIKTLLSKMPEGTPLVAHNNAFELAVTELELGIELEGVHDTNIMSSYVDENRRSGLKSLSKEILNYTQTTYKEVVGDRQGMFELTANETLQYGCDDSIVTAHLYDFMMMIMMLERTWDFYVENEIYVQNPLTEAYINGVEIDWDRLEEIHEEDKEKIKTNMAFIRQELEKHSLEPNEAGAESFIAADIENRRILARKKARDAFEKEYPDYNPEEIGVEFKQEYVEGKVEAELIKFRNAAIKGSAYIPYSEEYVAPEFNPTVTALNKIIAKLGIEKPLESVAKSRISEWAASVLDYDFDNKEAEDNQILNADQKLFVDTLTEAAAELKKREGDAYNRLVDVCKPFAPEGKIVKSGDELNMGSYVQVQHLLYCKLGMPVRLRTQPDFLSARHKLNLEGNPGTDDLAVDTALAQDLTEDDWRWDVLMAIKEVKEAKTRCSLYHTKYPLWKHPYDGRMHPQIRNCGTVTRRPSGNSPNILQVSKHKIEGAMRGVYLPHKEKFNVSAHIWIPYEEPRVIVSPDFSQQELRILASESGDTTMQSAYIGDNPKDIHNLTASGIAKLAYEEYQKIYLDETHPLHKEMVNIRKKPSKATNFLIAYLGTAFTLSQRLIIPYDEADEFMENTHALYPGIREWQEEMGRFGRKYGYTLTAYGNRRHLSNNIFSGDDQTRRRMERQAANAVIQGTAADILKIVMGNIQKTRLLEETNSILLAPIYDEVASTVPISQVVKYLERLIPIMEITPPGHAVPMVSDVAIGPDWQMLDEIGTHPSEDAIMASCEKAVKLQEKKAAARKAA